MSELQDLVSTVEEQRKKLKTFEVEVQELHHEIGLLKAELKAEVLSVLQEIKQLRDEHSSIKTEIEDLQHTTATFEAGLDSEAKPVRPTDPRALRIPLLPTIKK